MQLERLTGNGDLNRFKDTTVVYSAQRMNSRSGLWHQTIGGMETSRSQEARQKLAGHAWHVTANYQIPVGFSDLQCGVESTQRTAILHQIRHHGKPQTPVALRSADQRSRTGSGSDGSSDMLHQRRAGKGQQGFVLSHPGAVSTGKYKASNGIHGGLTHEKMVSSPDRAGRKTVVLDNKKLYICFMTVLAPLVLAMLAASPTRAAERPVASSLLTATQSSRGKVSVVSIDRRTGKLVRSVSGASADHAARIPSPPEKISILVEKSARANGIDPLLVHSVIQVESNYNMHAVSPKGAEGLMQLMPGTSRELGVGNSFDPAQNIEAGVRYLRQLQDQYKDDRLALAAYNAGPKAVERYRNIPPYAETQNYVEQVGRRYRAAHKVAVEKAAQVPAQGVSAVAESERREKPAKLEQFFDHDGRLSLRTVRE